MIYQSPSYLFLQVSQYLLRSTIKTHHQKQKYILVPEKKNIFIPVIT